MASSTSSRTPNSAVARSRWKLLSKAIIKKNRESNEQVVINTVHSFNPFEQRLFQVTAHIDDTQQAVLYYTHPLLQKQILLRCAHVPQTTRTRHTISHITHTHTISHITHDTTATISYHITLTHEYTEACVRTQICSWSGITTCSHRNIRTTTATATTTSQ